MTNNAYAKNNRVDFLYKLVFCAYIVCTLHGGIITYFHNFVSEMHSSSIITMKNHGPNFVPWGTLSELYIWKARFSQLPNLKVKPNMADHEDCLGTAPDPQMTGILYILFTRFFLFCLLFFFFVYSVCFVLFVFCYSVYFI